MSGHILHSIFWKNMAPKGGGAPTEDFLAAIERDFKDFNRIRRQLTEVASSIMGSGWAALVWEPIGKRLLITQIYDHQSNLAQAGVLTQSTMLPPAHAAFCRPGLFYTHGAVSPIVHGAVAFDHWSCRTFSHPKVIFSLSVGGSPLPLRFVLAPVVMVFSKLSPRPNWNVSCYCGEREWVSYAMATSITRLD